MPRVRLDESLVSELTSKTNDSIINENLKGLKQVEIAGSYGLNPSRVSQIWNEFLSKINKELNEGLMFSEIKENNKKIQFPEKWLETKFEESKIELGDCIEKLGELKDNTIDCVVTDPPYGIDYCSNHPKDRSYKNKEIKGDKTEAFKLLENSVKLLKKKCKKDTHIYVFCSWKTYPQFSEIISRYFKIKNCLVWVKNNHGMGDLKGNYAEKYEMIIFATNGRKEFDQLEKRPLNVFLSNGHYSRLSGRNHPTEKPTDLIGEIIALSTKPGEIVADPFIGSGSTAIAARKNKRRWWGCEIDKEFYDIAKKRITEE